MSNYKEENTNEISELILCKKINRDSLNCFLKSFFHFIPTKSVQFLTFYNYINLPMFISEKTFYGFFQNNVSTSYDKMLTKIMEFYFGDIEERINILISILDFDKKGIINVEDVKNFFRNFNYIHNSQKDNREWMGYEIIENFFKNNTEISNSEFKNLILSENCDVFYLFSAFYSRNLFFNYDCYNYYEKNFYRRSQNFDNRDDELLFEKNIIFLNQLPYPSDMLLDFFNARFKTTFTLDEFKDLENFENEIKQFKKIIKNFTSIKSIIPARKIKTDTNLSIIQKSIIELDNTDTTSNIQSNYSLKVLNNFMKKPNGLETFKGEWIKNGRFCKYYLDIFENTVYIYSSTNELKLLFSTNQLYCEIPNDPEDKIVKDGRGKYPLIFYSTLTNNIKKCILYFENISTPQKIISLISKTIKYNSLNNKRFINQNIMDHGSFGQIIKAYDNVLKKEVAIKTINKKYDDLETLKMIRNEQDFSLILKNMKHKGIIEIYDIFESKDMVYIIEEFIDGGNLKDYLIKNQTTFEEKDLIINQLIDAIYFLHSYYIVHRDLKLENILVSHATKPIQIKIIDFGLSKIFTINEKMHEKYGTLLYLPPEIVLNDQYSSKIDIWLFGIIIYTILNKGVHPFSDETEVEHLLQKIISKQFNFDIFPEKYKELLKVCLVKEKDRADIKKIIEIFK